MTADARFQVLVPPGVLNRPHQDIRRHLHESGCEVVEMVRQRGDEDELIALLRDADGVIAGGELYTPRVLAAVPRLKVISRWGIGVDAVDLAAATENGIVVTNTPYLTTPGVADLTFGLLLSVARRIPECDRLVRAGGWQEMYGADVWQQCLGLVGFGSIGQAVAHRARGFDMRVLAYDIAPNRQAAAELGVELTDLDTLLREADFVSLHCSATPENRGMIGRRELALMKPTAFLINAARGSLVDEPALVEALRNRTIAGAALDVHASEPPPPTYPLRELDNCVMTPHTASMTPRVIAHVSRQAVANLLAVLHGQRPEYVVNPEVYDRPH